MPTPNLYAAKIVKVNATVHIIEQTSTLRPDNTDNAASLKAIDDAETNGWNLLANINTFKISPQTEDDEVEFFDAATLSRVKDPQTSILRRNVEMTAVNYPLLLDAIVSGVPNPTSAETLAKLAAGSNTGAPIFASNEAKVPVGCKVTFYDARQNKLKTMYFYADLMATGEQEYNGKTIQPTITAEIKPSIHNLQFNEAAFTGEAATS